MLARASPHRRPADRNYAIALTTLGVLGWKNPEHAEHRSQYTSYQARSTAVVGVALPFSAFRIAHFEYEMTALPITTF